LAVQTQQAGLRPAGWRPEEARAVASLTGPKADALSISTFGTHSLQVSSRNKVGLMYLSRVSRWRLDLIGWELPQWKEWSDDRHEEGVFDRKSDQRG
jgi:hypothetical protein